MSERRPNLKDTAADHLRERIFSGELRPGDKIDQDAVAKRLGMSKLPVREALITLESESLIENVARRGSFVALIDPDDVRDHYRIYGLVSAVAARRAAESLTGTEIDRLQAIVDQMQQLAIGPMSDRNATSNKEQELNFQFHRAINLAGGSRRLLSVLHLLSQSIPTRFYAFTTGWAHRAIEHHREIIDAFRRRDGEAAARAMAAHLAESGEGAVRMLEESGFWDEAHSMLRRTPDAT